MNFKNPTIAKALRERGFYVGDLLEHPDIARLMASYDELLEMAGDHIGKLFWPSGRSPDAGVRNFAKTEIEKIVPRRLEQYVDPSTTEFIGGTFLIKPPSDESALNPHQDSSHVDERHGYSVYAWIPLTDTSEENGCFYYLPGSHRWTIHQRSLNVPWPLTDIEMDMWPLMVPLPMKAGRVLFFHSALVHASSPNKSGATRVALNFYLHPKDTPFCHFYTDETMPEGKVEMYAVRPEFYYSEDFESRPDPDRYPLLEVLDISTFDRERVLSLL